MDTDHTVEQQIQAEIERIRGQFPQTQDLYREVCVLLFFRFGITPTANKLYQFVRKGSMSAPAEALTKFWQDLREKSRVRIEHPDLPDDLRVAAGELTATLWGKAQAQSIAGRLKQPLWRPNRPRHRRKPTETRRKGKQPRLTNPFARRPIRCAH